MSYLVADRLANFQTGVTNTDPASSAPKVGGYSVCGTMGGAVGGGATHTFECPGCGVTGRYAVVQLKGTNYLTLCEVRIFGCECFIAIT